MCVPVSHRRRDWCELRGLDTDRPPPQAFLRSKVNVGSIQHFSRCDVNDRDGSSKTPDITDYYLTLSCELIARKRNRQDTGFLLFVDENGAV